MILGRPTAFWRVINTNPHTAAPGGGLTPFQTSNKYSGDRGLLKTIYSLHGKESSSSCIIRRIPAGALQLAYVLNFRVQAQWFRMKEFEFMFRDLVLELRV